MWRGYARGAAWFVWSVWALLFLAALAFVGRFGSNVPYWDEWNMVTVLVGDQAVDIPWLWSEHNGHRIPLPRLLLLALYKLTGADFRAGMYFNVFALGALAFTMIWVAKGQRGGMSYADAFFPLILLHWGHYENLLWTWQVTQVTPIIITCVLLLIIMQRGARLTLGIGVLAGFSLVLLPLCGIPGLVYVPALALWLGYAGMLRWSPEHRGKWRSLMIWGLAAAALFVVAFYFFNYREPARHLSSLHPRASLVTVLQFLTGSFGTATESFWPYSGLGMLGLWLLTAGMLVGAVWRHPSSERSRALGLLLFMIAGICLALSVGLGRRGYGFTSRYFLLAVPALCCAYYAWGVYSPPAVGHLAQVGLFALIALMSPHNFQEGLDYGRVYHHKMEAFQLDLLAGEPISKLLARHARSLCPCPFGGEPTWGNVEDEGRAARAGLQFPMRDCISFHDRLGDSLRALHRTGIGYFRLLHQEHPVFRELRLSVVPTISTQPTGEELTGQRTKNGSNLILALQEPQFISGIRVTYYGDLHPNREGRPPCLQVFWRRSDQNEFTRSQRYIHYWGLGENQETIWVYDTINKLSLNIDNNPNVSNLLEVVLLVSTAER